MSCVGRRSISPVNIPNDRHRPYRATEVHCVKAQIVRLATHPQFNERWVQECIAGDPAIRGLGHLVLPDRETESASRFAGWACCSKTAR
jgi:hypothetical protein